MSFFRSRQPSRKKVPKMTSQSPSGTLPGTRLEGKIGLLVALGAFQGRFWTPKGGPNGTQNRSKIDLGAQGPPKSAQEPPGGPKRPPRRPEFEALRGPQAHEKAIRKYWSKGLSKPLYARSTNDPWLSGRYWGRSLASPGLLWLLLAVPGLAGIPWPLSSCLSGLRCPSPLASPGLPWPPLVAARGLP